jgi:hypothetical protein
MMSFQQVAFGVIVIKKESEERFDEPMYGEKIGISSSTEVAM